MTTDPLLREISIILQNLSVLPRILLSGRGLKLHVVDIQKEYGATISQLAQKTHRARLKTCSVCGLVKRHVMNRVTRDFGYHALATGHNLDDEVATLFGNTLNWAGEYLLRQGPVLPGTPGLGSQGKTTLPDLRTRDVGLCPLAWH